MHQKQKSLCVLCKCFKQMLCYVDLHRLSRLFALQIKVFFLMQQKAYVSCHSVIPETDSLLAVIMCLAHCFQRLFEIKLELSFLTSLPFARQDTSPRLELNSVKNFVQLFFFFSRRGDCILIASVSCETVASAYVSVCVCVLWLGCSSSGWQPGLAVPRWGR